MLKKTITYEDYNGDTVSEDFYFNFTKLEIMEKLELEDLQAQVDRLTKTEDAKEAYGLFKKLVLDAYGEKSLDGKRFIKSPELTAGFEQSPACSELIIEFLQNPDVGAKFIESTLPSKMVEEAKALQASEDKARPELPTAPPVLEGSTDDKRPAWIRENRNPSPKELQSMSRDELQEAMKRKSEKQNS